MHRKFAALIGLAAAAAAGFRGVLFNIGNSVLDRYSNTNRRSTVQYAGIRGYPKHPPGTVAQAKRDARKARNKARHRAACKKVGHG